MRGGSAAGAASVEDAAPPRETRRAESVSVVVARLWNVAFPPSPSPVARLTAALAHADHEAPPFFARTQRGTVLRLARDLASVDFLSYAVARADPALREISQSAFHAQTFAIVAVDGARVAHVLAATVTPTDLHAVVATAVGAPAATRWWQWLAVPEQRRARILPHVQAALAEQEATIAAGAAEPDAKLRTPENLLWRSRQLLFVKSLEETMATTGVPQTVTAAAFRESVSRAHVDISGHPRDVKPSPSDYAALAESCGWERVTKAQSSWPFLRPAPTGELEIVDVNGLMRELESARGGAIADDDPVWTIFEHLYAHQPAFVTPADGVLQGADNRFTGLSLEQRVAANGGKPLRLGTVHRFEGAIDAAITAQLEKNAKLGVTTELSASEIADIRRCAVISPVRPVIKGKLVPSPAAVAALALDGPDADIALAAAVAAQADEIVARVVLLAETNAEAPPHLMLEQALAESRDATTLKVRACVNGHDLSEYIHDASFSYVAFDDIAAMCTEGAVIGKIDGKSFFYIVPYATAAKRFLCIEYAERVWVQNRLSMGACDSPALGSALSALICEIVSLRTGAFIRAYIDDILNVSPAGLEQGAAVQVVVREVMKAANVPESLEKAALGTNVPVLGRVIDSVAMTVSLPRASVFAYMMHLAIVRRLLMSSSARARLAVTTANIMSLNGKLGWWSRALLRARCHLGGVIAAATSGTSVAALRVPIIADLTWWETTWATGALATEVLLQPTADAHIICLSGGGADDVGGADAAARGGARRVTTDAGDHGGGAIFRDEALYLEWSREEKEKPSDWREARMTLEAVRHWAPFWAASSGGKPARVLLLMDHLGNVFGINRGRARRAEATALIADIYAVAEEFNIFFTAAWIPREANLGADALSKCKSNDEALDVARDLGKRLVATWPGLDEPYFDDVAHDSGVAERYHYALEHGLPPHGQRTQAHV